MVVRRARHRQVVAENPHPVWASGWNGSQRMGATWCTRISTVAASRPWRNLTTYWYTNTVPGLHSAMVWLEQPTSCDRRLAIGGGGRHSLQLLDWPSSRSGSGRCAAVGWARRCLRPKCSRPWTLYLAIRFLGFTSLTADGRSSWRAYAFSQLAVSWWDPTDHLAMAMIGAESPWPARPRAPGARVVSRSTGG